MANFKPIYDTTLKHEGGFQKFANDSANYVNGKLIGTNKGISASAWATFYKRTPTEADMKALTHEQAAEIFKKNYWNKINGDKIKNQAVAQMMFQFIIGSGASQLSDLKDIASITARKKGLLKSNDLPITDKEAEIINSINPKAYWESMKYWRHSFFLKIVKKNPKLLQFLKGWQKRLNSYVFNDDGSLTNTSKGVGGVAFFFIDSLGNINYSETPQERKASENVGNETKEEIKPDEVV